MPGTVWGEDVELARPRLDALEAAQVTWLEEPFVGEALQSYQSLAGDCRTVQLAGGEGASNVHAARNLIDHGGIRFVQIDTGRVGGIAPAKAIADYARSQGVTYVNHTFTTHLALAASLAPYAGIEEATLCEYPVEASELARSLTSNRLDIVDGLVHLNEAPGLGIRISEETIREYLVPVEIRVGDNLLFTSIK